MKELIKKTMMTGIGLAAVSKEKIEELVKEMIEKGNMTEQEGSKLVQEMVGYAEKTKGDLEKQVDKYIEKALDRMDIARKSDIKELQTAIKEIQDRLATEKNK